MARLADAREAGQHFAREAHDAGALGPETKMFSGIPRGIVFVLPAGVARRGAAHMIVSIVIHRDLPSVRTMRTFCCLSPPRRSSAAAKRRSTM